MSEIQEVIFEILKPYCKCHLELNTDLFLNGLDSFNMVNVLVALERHYKIMFEDEELDLHMIRTVEGLERFVQSKLEEA